MRRDAAFLALSMLCVTAAGACFALPASPYARALAAAPLVFVLPGAALLQALRADLAAPGRQALTVGLSITLCLLGGLLLGGIGLLTPLGWLLWLGGTTLGGALIGLWRSRTARLSWRWPVLKLRHAALLAATVGVVAMTAVISVRNREAYLPFPYTNFWMVPVRPASNLYTIGIKNAERETQQFTIRVMVDGAIIGIWTGIAVAPGQTITHTVMMPAGRKAEAWLLRGTRSVEVYRMVSASLPHRP